jgi:hypothetical protein
MFHPSNQISEIQVVLLKWRRRRRRRTRKRSIVFRRKLLVADLIDIYGLLLHSSVILHKK